MSEGLDALLETDKDHPPRGDAPHGRGAPRDMPQGETGHIDRDVARHIEQHHAGAREFAGRFGQEAKRQRDQEARAPDREQPPAIHARCEKIGDAIVAARRVREDKQQRDEWAKPHVRRDQPAPAMREAVIERLGDQGRAEHDEQFDQRRRRRQEGARQGGVSAREFLAPAAATKRRLLKLSIWRVFAGRWLYPNSIGRERQGSLQLTQDRLDQEQTRRFERSCRSMQQDGGPRGRIMVKIQLRTSGSPALGMQSRRGVGIDVFEVNGFFLGERRKNWALAQIPAGGFRRLHKGVILAIDYPKTFVRGFPSNAGPTPSCPDERRAA